MFSGTLLLLLKVTLKKTIRNPPDPLSKWDGRPVIIIASQEPEKQLLLYTVDVLPEKVRVVRIKKEEGGILLDDRCWLSLASLSWGGYARRGRGRRWQHWMGGHPSSSAEWKWAENCFSFFFSAPGGVLVFTLCVNNHSSLLPRESAAASRASHASSARDRGISISAIYSNITTTKTTTRLLRRLLSKERS